MSPETRQLQCNPHHHLTDEPYVANMRTLRVVSMMALWTIAAVTAVFISSCASPAQHNDPLPEATTRAGTTTYSVNSTAAISPATMARLRAIQAIVSKTRATISCDIVGDFWKLIIPTAPQRHRTRTTFLACRNLAS